MGVVQIYNLFDLLSPGPSYLVPGVGADNSIASKHSNRTLLGREPTLPKFLLQYFNFD